MNGLSKLSSNARDALKLSHTFTKEKLKKSIDLVSLMYGLMGIKDGIAYRILQKDSLANLVTDLINTHIENDVSSNYTGELGFSEEARAALENAYLVAKSNYHVYVGTEHILLGIFKIKDSTFIKELNKIGLTYDYIEKNIYSYANYPVGLLSKFPIQEDKSNSILSLLATNLNDKARNKEFNLTLGREKEVSRIIHILERKSKNNPLLIGEAGVGKTSIIEGLVEKIVLGDIPEEFRKMEVWSLDPAKLMASTEMRGDLEAKITALIEEVSSKNNIIIFIDEIHSVFGGLGNGSNDISNLLKPYLTKGNLRFIGTTTYTEYQKFFDGDQALSRRFQQVFVDEISESTAVDILHNVKKDLELYHKIRITNEAVLASVFLSNKYISERMLPDKAIDVLDEACAKVKMERQTSSPDVRAVNLELNNISYNKEKYINNSEFEKALDVRNRERELKIFLNEVSQKVDRKRVSSKYIVTDEVVRTVISNWTGIPVNTLSKIGKNSLKNMEVDMKKFIIGQDDAVNKVTKVIQSAKLGIKNDSRTLGSFLFLGPTGVGKTELAKQLALNLFGDLKSFIQIDMSEYMESHTVSKFIGSPPGYIGFQEGGQLTEKIRKRPYSVVLFDEIEKAHPDVLNILLQILEEGRLTDSKGKVISFKNTVIILTSNIGAQQIQNDSILGFNVINTAENVEKEAYEAMRDRILVEMKTYLSPEFINRLDDILIFRGLSKENIEAITIKFIDELRVRLAKLRINLSYSDEVISFISNIGFNKEYGARPIRRAIEEYIEFPITEIFLVKNLGKKDYDIKIRVKSNKIDLAVK